MSSSYMSVGSCAMANINPLGPCKLSILQPPDVFVGIWVGFPFYYLFPVKTDVVAVGHCAFPSSWDIFGFWWYRWCFYDFLDQAVSSMPTRREKKGLITYSQPSLSLKNHKVEADALDPHLESKIHDLRKHSGFDGSIGSWKYFTNLHCQFHLALKILQVIVDHNIHQKIAVFWGLSFHPPTTWQCQKHSKLKLEKVKGSLEHYFCTEKQ